MEDQPTKAEPRPAEATPTVGETKQRTSAAADTSGSTEGSATGGGGTSAARRRRRRGGRGRGGASRKPSDGTSGEESEPKEAGAEETKPEAKLQAKPRTKPQAKPQAKPAPRRRSPAKPKPSDDSPEGTPSTDGSRDAAAQEGGEEAGEGTGAPKRRRRRGGRGRGGKKPSGAVGGEETEDGEAAEKAASEKRPASGRRRSSTAKKEKAEEAAPISTRRTARSSRTTTRTRTGGGRRRETLPLVRRVENKVMVITERGERDQIAVLEDRELVQHYITRVGAHSMVGNIYMARVQNVLPGMEAAFLDIGRGRNAVLYAGEVNYDEEVEGSKSQRIEHVLKPNQAEMVQVTKDPMGGKGARLTAQVSLPGRYLVLVPNSQVFGISRRLPDDERKRLRTAIKKLMPEHHGIIVRTAAEGATEEALADDVERLVGEWDSIAKKAKKVKAPDVLYEEPELTVRVVRDLFNGEEFREMVTDSPRIYEMVTTYLGDIAPDLLDKVRLHEGALPAFEEFHIVEQIHKALDRKVWLPSGGYLIIDRTEALTVIDVNTGKHVGKTNLEETVVKTNLEAAEEVARQLRLRDIGGMIIVDFIDMLLEQNKKKVIQTIKDALAQDKTRSQVFDISPLGLLEMTRKRVSAGLLESFSETCPTCEGRGILLTLEV